MLISPDTKIAALLEAFPQLEETLLRMTPAFAKLRHPALRNTVAKVATLHQAAAIGGVPIGTLIATLRTAAGQQDAYDAAQSAAAADDAPPWFASGPFAATYDARADLAAGQHPVQRVMKDLDHLAPDGVYALVTPFRPIPLIDMARSKGFDSWSRILDDDTVTTYFIRAVG